MPKKNTISSIPAVDLAYAVERLVAAGKTTAAEVLDLAADRGKRIALLEAELKALRGGGVVRAPATKATPPAAKRGRPAKRVRKAAPKAAPKATTALGAFRKLQGKYMGLLRNFAGAERDRIKAVAKAHRFPAAIAEMKRLLAKGGVRKAAKSATAKKAVAKPALAKKPAPRKLKITPKRRAQLKLQGVYIGMIRGLPDAQKAKIKAVAKEKGFAAAIEVIKKLPGKK